MTRHRQPTTAVEAALQVLVLTRQTREYLKANDPQALKQACAALSLNDLQYLLPDQATDLCWYCFGVLDQIDSAGLTRCRACGSGGPHQLQGEGQ